MGLAFDLAARMGGGKANKLRGSEGMLGGRKRRGRRKRKGVDVESGY